MSLDNVSHTLIVGRQIRNSNIEIPAFAEAATRRQAKQT